MRVQAGAAGRLPFARPLASRLKRAVLAGRFRTHEFGMVGFVRELVDELGVADIRHPGHDTGPQRASKIREMRLSPSHLFVVKA